MSAEDGMWLVGPFVIALLACRVAQRTRPRNLWAVIIPPYAVAAIVYAWQGYAALRQGFVYVDGYPLAVAWNAAGAALFLGAVAHVATLRRWPLGRSVLLAGFAGVIPAVTGIMGAGAVFGGAGALLVFAAHWATRPDASPAA